MAAGEALPVALALARRQPVPNDAPHQGVVIEVEPLEDMWLSDLLSEAPERAVQVSAYGRPVSVTPNAPRPHAASDWRSDVPYGSSGSSGRTGKPIQASPASRPGLTLRARARRWSGAVR